MIVKVEGIFCPECKSDNVKCQCVDETKWASDECIISDEVYACSACGHEFGIMVSYTMDGFNFLGVDDDDTDYDIERD